VRIRALASTLLLLSAALLSVYPWREAEEPGTRVQVLASLALAERSKLLDELAQVAADGKPEGEVTRKIEGDFEDGMRALRHQLAGLAGVITDEFPFLGATALEVPRANLTALAALDCIAELSKVGEGGPLLHRVTNEANHNARYVHQQLGVTGEGTVLAILDTGLDLDSDGQGTVHPAFQDEQGNSRVIAAFNVNHPGDLEDQLGHGTAVAGIAAARDYGNDPAFPEDGFAPGASIVSYKLTSGNNANSRWQDLAAAIDHLFRNAGQLDIKVLNISFPGEPSPLHILEQSMDQLALTRDILIVTSAGNGGGNPLQTFESHSNANGIAVASADPDSHTVSSFSSRGPLSGDPERFWPDISAIGRDVIAPIPDDSETSSSPLSGTSFAAPAVAGTAVLIRSLDPSLSAFDTKAIILNSVKAMETVNPFYNRNSYGLGLLRTDFAVDSVNAGDLMRGSLQGDEPLAARTIDVVDGELYSATLVWPRYDLSSLAWDNLDLRIIDSEGRVLAISDSPRNLYERVVFRARHSGSYRIEVQGIGQLDQPVSWSLALASERGGARQAGTYHLQGTACAGIAANPTDGVVLPDTSSQRFGNSRTNLPFAQEPNRMQVAYHGSQVPENLRVTKIAFRRDERSVCAPNYEIEIAIRIGHTDVHPAGLSKDFDANPKRDSDQDHPGGALTTVLSRRTVQFTGIHGLPLDEGQFDLVIPLDTPFVTRTSVGQHLLLDIQVFSHSANSQPLELWFDAEENYDLFGRVLNLGNPEAQSGTKDAIAPIISLMTDELTSTEPSMVVDSLPQLGETMTVILRNAMPGTAAALMHGFDDRFIGGQQLPLPLDSTGAPGCILYNSADVFLPVWVGPDGQAKIEYRIPDNPSLSGVRFHNQFFVLNPGVNELGIVSSNAGIGRVGG
jgi:hypothetical protein